MYAIILWIPTYVNFTTLSGWTQLVCFDERVQESIKKEAG